MKVLGIFSLIMACVSARGSGPYLPSGWKPDGPAFFLPSEFSKSLNEPQKDNIFSESEASGSDFLREYGPPEIQAASQDILQQGLPDVLNEQLFVENVVKTYDEKENSEVTEIKEVKAAETFLATTESQVFSATESISNNNEEIFQVNDETTTLGNDAKHVDAVDEYGYKLESTLGIIVPTEKITIEESVQSEDQEIRASTFVEAEQQINQHQESDQSNEVQKLAINDATQILNESQPSSDIVTKQAEYSSIKSSDASATQQTNLKLNVVSAIEKKVETVQEEIRTVENIVQNIPELIVNLENEIKSQSVKSIQEVPVAVEEPFGSLEQVPEGFLEYGPPGFQEYGPPKEDLRDNSIEEKLPEGQSIDKSERRRRRFSPKFSSSQISS